MEKILWDEILSSEDLPGANLTAESLDDNLWAGVDNWLNDWEGAAL